MPFLHERLPNGLDVIAETTAAAVSTSLGFFVKTGSRDESDAVWGVSHFLEHMIFKGTPEISGDEINRRFDRMGASINAFTSEEDTVYYATVLPEQQHEAFDLLARMMRPALREADFDTEKLVILEEIRMYDDQPPFGADDRCRAAFFASASLKAYSRSAIAISSSAEYGIIAWRRSMASPSAPIGSPMIGSFAAAALRGACAPAPPGGPPPMPPPGGAPAGAAATT